MPPRTIQDIDADITACCALRYRNLTGTLWSER